MIKDILIYPRDEEILTKKSEIVTEINNDIKTLIQDLIDTLDNTKNGCGISAIQIGEAKQVCVIKPINNKKIIMINPRIIKAEGICLFTEGCLSAPGAKKQVKRAKKVTVEYIDENGEKHKVTRGGLTAIIIQHELDHFTGWCEVFDNVLREERENDE